MADNEGPGWERRVLEGLAGAALKEQRTARRWGIFFKLLTFAYITFALVVFVDWSSTESLGEGKHTALIDLEGVIDATGEASADKINTALQNAFGDRNTRGVILKINSPGGSPVQSGIINDEMRRLRELHPDIPLYAVVEDICASGGYYVASGADRIYVNKASIVGSIGVLMDGFGFTGSMDKLGVERRLLTAGANKGFLDPFSPIDASQRAYAQNLLNDIHQQFIGVVKQGRGKRLKDDPEMFSGLMWTGQKSIDLGLADGLGTVDSVARDVIKAQDIVDYTQKDKLVERFAKRIGAGVSGKLDLFQQLGSWRLR
jgi:protease-4